MFHEQRAGKIGNADAERGLIERGDENASAIRRKPHKARRSATGGGAELAFIDEAEFAERSEPIRDDGAPKLAVPLDFLAGGGLFSADKVEDVDEAGCSGF